MMYSISQVNEEFFKIFYNLEIPYGDTLLRPMCRYAKKSSFDYTEEQDYQIYPCIALQDYTPSIRSDWYVDMKQYVGEYTEDNVKAYLYHRPIWMLFRYDVSIATKSYKEFMAMQDFFLRHFVYEKRFIFDKHLADEDLVGDIIPYEISEIDIPRTDGVFEKNYEFSLSVWVAPKEPEAVDVIQKIVINAENVEEI